MTDPTVILDPHAVWMLIVCSGLALFFSIVQLAIDVRRPPPPPLPPRDKRDDPDPANYPIFPIF
jgi:hypothetical protein